MRRFSEGISAAGAGPREKKLRMVKETSMPGNSVSRVSRMHGVANARGGAGRQHP